MAGLEGLPDPLSVNFSGQDGAGGAYIFPDRPGGMNAILSLVQRAKEREQKGLQQTQSDANQMTAQVGKAWERDSDDLLGRLNGYIDKAKEYNFSKGGAKEKAALQKELILARGKLMQDVNKSAKNAQNYNKWATDMAKNPDAYDEKDWQQLDDFYNGDLDTRDQTFAPERASETNVLKIFQQMDLPTEKKTVQWTDKNGQSKTEVRDEVVMPDAMKQIDFMFNDDNKHMRAYKRNFRTVHPGGTDDEMKADMLDAWVTKYKERTKKDVYKAAPASKDDTPELSSDGTAYSAGAKTNRTNYTMAKTSDDGFLLSINTQKEDENKVLKWQVNFDSKGNSTDAMVDGRLRGINKQKGNDYVINIAIKEPILDNKGHVIRTVDKIVAVPATNFNWNLVKDNYPGGDPLPIIDKLNPAAEKKWQEAKAAGRAYKPAMTGKQKLAKGIAANNKAGKKPTGL